MIGRPSNAEALYVAAVQAFARTLDCNWRTDPKIRPLIYLRRKVLCASVTNNADLLALLFALAEKRWMPGTFLEDLSKIRETAVTTLSTSA